jgi:hypothetical protein
MLQAQPICPPAPVTIGPVQLAIDHFEFGQGEIRHNTPATVAVYDMVDDKTTGVDGFQTQLAQQVIVYVTTVNDVMLHPNDSPAIILAFPFSILFDIDLYTHHSSPGNPSPDAGDCYLNFQLDSVTPLLPPFIPPNFDPGNIPFPVALSDVLGKLTDIVGAQFPRPALSLRQIAGLLPGSNPVLLNAGVSVDAQNQIIDLRVEIGETANINEWSNFYKGFIDDRMQGADWALFVQKGYLEIVLQTLVADALDAFQPGNPQIFVTCTYSNLASTVATLTVGVEAVEGVNIPFLPLTIQIDGKASVPIEASVPALDVLQADIYLPDLKELAQSIVAPFESIFRSFLGPLGSWLAGLIDSAITQIKDPDFGPACSRYSPEKIRCQVVAPIPALPIGASVRVTELLALAEGVSLAGSISFERYTYGPFSFRVQEFRWDVPAVSCSAADQALAAAFGNSPQGFRILWGNAYLDQQGTAPVTICSARVVDDSLGAFPQNGVIVDNQAARIVLGFPILPDAYYRNGPYPCDLLVATTAGLRLVRFQPEVARPDLDKLRAVWDEKVVSCKQLIDPWFQLHRGYNPHWSPDPPPFDRTVFHWWEVDITGFNSGEGAILQYQGQELMHAISVAGAVRMTALVAPAGENEMSILPRLQDRALWTETFTGDRGIAVRQRNVVSEGTISLASPCKRLMAAPVNGSNCVIAVLQEAVAAYDVNMPLRPRPAGFWRAGHVRGVVRVDGGLLIYGADGTLRIDQNGGAHQAANPCALAKALDVAASSSFLYAVVPDGLEVLSPSNLCRVHQKPIERARAVLPVGGMLAIAGAGLAIYDLSDPAQPKREWGADLEMEIRELRRESGAPGKEFTALLEDGSARSFQLGNEGLQETARYPELPWFAAKVVIGRAVVGIGSSGATLELSRLGASAVL